MVAAKGRLWDTESGLELQRMASDDSDSFRVNVISPDNRFVASLKEFGNRIVLWNAQTGKLATTLAPAVDSAGDVEDTQTVVFSPDAAWLASSGASGLIRVWNTTTYDLFRQISVRSRVTSLAFSPDGNLLAAALGDGTASVWNISENRQVLAIAPGSSFRPDWPLEATSVAFSPDGGELLVGYSDSMARMWNTEDGRFIRSFTPHLNFVNGVAFSPDGAVVATASGNDNTYASVSQDFDWRVRLWDVQTGELIDVLEKPGRHQALHSIAFNLNGQTILASDYTTPIFWSTTGEIFADSARLIQRQPAEFTVEERERFGLD